LRKSRRRQPRQQAQPYDTSLKTWVKDMYDPLWDEHPKVKKIQAESEARGLRNAIVTIVKTRFPELTELAQQKAAQIDQPEVLNYLIEQVTAAPDEEVMRWILRPSAA
jgi:hypothetical protein